MRAPSGNLIVVVSCMRSIANACILSVLALAAMLLPPASAQTVPEHKIIRVVPFADLATLDPITTTAGNVQSHAFMVYDFLFGRDARQVPRPQMVDTWTTSPDGLVWRFTLRERLAFHDGAPVTAEDVVASLKRWGARDPHGRLLFAATETLTALDARSVELKLKQPFGMVLQALSKSGSNVPAIMPKRIADSDPFKAITDPTGSGPFIFAKDEWRPGAKAVYLRNPNYVPRAEPADGTAGGKVVHVDRVEWLTLADPQAAVFALKAGEIDFMENTPVDLIPELKQQGIGLQVTNTLGHQGMLRPNHLHPPFNDVRARRALLYLIDQERYLRAAWGDADIFKSCYAVLVCGAALASTAGVEPDFGKNRDKARQLLAEAGYKGETLVILQPTDIAFLSNLSLLLAQDLRAIGAKVELVSMDFSTLAQRRANKKPPSEGGWNFVFTWWNGTSISDPVGNVPLGTGCDKAWPGWPCDAAHQALIDAFPGLTAASAQQAHADKIQASAMQVVPYVPIGMWYQPVAFSPKLKDLLPVPGAMIFWNARKSG
jgi:peptide/nickel transport system substrate-binding protein